MRGDYCVTVFYNFSREKRQPIIDHPVFQKDNNLHIHSDSKLIKVSHLGKTSIEKKTFSFGHCPNYGGGGLPMPEFFGPLSRSAFLLIKRVYFFKNAIVLNFELFFRLLIYLPPLPPSDF